MCALDLSGKKKARMAACPAGNTGKRTFASGVGGRKAAVVCAGRILGVGTAEET